MTAFNVVRFRVKPGHEKAFVEMHRNMQRVFPGARRFSLVKTGEHTYCIVGEWDHFDSIVAAREMMIANLNQMRDMLEDFGSGVGITDPVSGEAVIDMWAGKKSGGAKNRKAAKRPAKAKKKSRTKKKSRRK